MGEKKFNILVVEDMDSVSDFIVASLKNSKIHYNIEKFDNISATIDRCKRGGIDAILLDLNLPDSQQYQTFDTVKKAAKNVPIIVISGIDDEALACKIIENGAEDFLLKGHMDLEMLGRSIQFSILRSKNRKK